MINIIQHRGIHQCLLLLSLWTSIALPNEVTPGVDILSGPCDPNPYCINGDKQGDPEDCMKYYECANGYWWSMSCPPGDEVRDICYHVDLEDCDWCIGDESECQRPCPTTTPNTGPTVTEAQAAPCDDHNDNCEDGMLYPDQHYCHMYWACNVSSLTGPTDCSPGLVFDFDAQECVQMHDGIDCDNRCPVTPTSNPTTEISTTVTKPITSTLDETTSEINTTVFSSASQITTEDMYSTSLTTHEPTTISRYTTTVLRTTTQNDITTLSSTTSELSTNIAISTPTSASSSDSRYVPSSQSTIPGTVPMSTTQMSGDSTEVSTTLQPTNSDVTLEVTTNEPLITTTTSTSTDISPDTDWIIIVGCVVGGFTLITLLLAGYIIFIKCRGKVQKRGSSGPSAGDLYLTSGPHDMDQTPTYVSSLRDEQHTLDMDDTQTSSSTGVDDGNIYNYISLDFDDHRHEITEDTVDVTHKRDNNTETSESDIGLYDILCPDDTLTTDHVYTTLT